MKKIMCILVAKIPEEYIDLENIDLHETYKAEVLRHGYIIPSLNKKNYPIELLFPKECFIEVDQLELDIIKALNAKTPIKINILKLFTLTIRMKKGDPKKERITVDYKGDKFELQPGHAVYECNTETGVVKEHKLVKAFTLPWRPKLYKPVYSENIIHTPAYNIDRAVVVFKKMLKDYRNSKMELIKPHAK